MKELSMAKLKALSTSLRREREWTATTISSPKKYILTNYAIFFLRALHYDTGEVWISPLWYFIVIVITTMWPLDFCCEVLWF